MHSTAKTPASYEYGTLQCYGANRYWVDWGGSGLKRSALSATNFVGADGNKVADVVADPDNASKLALMFSVRPTDPDTNGSKRCELSLGWTEYTYPGKIPVTKRLLADTDYWWAVEFRTDDWRGTMKNDTQSVWQLLHATGSGSPALSLQVSGSTATIRTASGSAAEFAAGKWVTGEIVSTELSPKVWHTMIVKGRINSTNIKASTATIWLDGKQIANYTGPIGYEGLKEYYPKVGVYHWISAKNPWDTSQPERKVWIGQALLAKSNSKNSLENVQAQMKDAR